MRTWYKYLLADANEKFSTGKDVTFAENAKTMDYARQEGLRNRQDFLSTHLAQGHIRFRIYDQLLHSILERKEKILSVASGRCVNEVVLAEEGYQITCSDLEVIAGVQKIFPQLRFAAYNLLKGAFPGDSFDAVLALQVFYLFDPAELKTAIQNLKSSLKSGGKLVVDISGAEDKWITRLIDEGVVKFEAYFKALVLRLLRKQRKIVSRKHHGFRYTDAEFVALMQKEGFGLVKVEKADYATEWERSYVLRRLGERSRLFKRFIEWLGRPVPYIRLFIFKKV